MKLPGKQLGKFISSRMGWRLGGEDGRQFSNNISCGIHVSFSMKIYAVTTH